MSLAFLRRHIGYRIFLAVFLVVVTSTAAISFYFIDQHRKSLLAQQRDTLRTLAQSTIQGIHAIMLTGSADMARQYADNQKQVPGLHDVRIMRTDGTEAFHDNATINAVNLRRGEFAFPNRDTETTVRVVARDDPALREAIRSGELTYVYREEAAVGRTLTYFAPLANLKGCHRCHGGDHPVRGVIKISAPMAAVEAEIRKTWSMALLAAPILLLAIGLIGLAIRRLTLPILHVATELQKIADGRGDLTVRLDAGGDDEIALLARGFNTFVSKIESAVGEITRITGELAATAGQLADGTATANTRAGSQRADAADIARTMGVLTGSVGTVLDDALQGSAAAREVDVHTREGLAKMNRSLESTERLVLHVEELTALGGSLEQGMQEIDTVVRSIQEIAKRTNLLALNASIEASRAGAGSNGFVVVADEVRRLAAGSAQSSIAIQHIIESLRARTTRTLGAVEGSRTIAADNLQQVRVTSRALNSIADGAGAIASISERIAGAMAQEKQIATTILDRLERISRNAEASSRGASETAGRSRDLAQLAARLQTLTQAFRQA